VRQRAPRLAPVGREPERAERAEVLPEARLHEVEHLLHHRIGREAHGSAEVDIVRCRLAVLVVVVPLAARGLVPLHQEAGLPPHLAVEPLHPEFLAPLGPGLELGMGAEETVVGEEVDGQQALFECSDQAELAGFGRQDLGCSRGLGCAQKLAHDGARVLRIVEPGVADAPSRRLQPRRELAHRCEDEGDLLGVVGHVGRLGHDLGNDDRIGGAVGLAQRRDLLRELVAEDEDKAAHHGISRPA
jgi:hypothetical protein